MTIEEFYQLKDGDRVIVDPDLPNPEVCICKGSVTAFGKVSVTGSDLIVILDNYDCHRYVKE